MSGSQRTRPRWDPKVPFHPIPVFIALGVLSAAYFAAAGTIWAVTGEFTRLGGQALQLVGVDPTGWEYFQKLGLEGSPIERADGWIVIGMLGGALAAALLVGDFKWRVPPLKRRMVQGLIGGVIAGFGARLALGCNLAAMFTGIPQFSFHAWIFTAMTALGTLVGTRLVQIPWWRGSFRVTKLGPADQVRNTPIPNIARQRTLGLIVTAVMCVVVVGYLVAGQWLLATAAGFGVIFGVLIQRGQICFTSAFRDLWLTGRAALGKALVIGLAAATIATYFVIGLGSTPIIFEASLGTAIGGLLFGLGIVIAGGCETGMMYRVMEGQVHYGLVFVGNIIGATLLAYGWDHWGINAALVEGAPKINLLEVLTPQGALLATLLVLALWYYAMVRRERRFRYTPSTDRAATTTAGDRTPPALEPLEATRLVAVHDEEEKTS